MRGLAAAHDATAGVVRVRFTWNGDMNLDFLIDKAFLGQTLAGASPAAAPIPEPGPGLLVLLGAGVLGYRRRR